MAIIFGGDAGITQNSYDDFTSEMSKRFDSLSTQFANAIENKGPPLPPKQNSYVDDGFSNVPGTAFSGSTVDNVDEVKKRRVTSQEPLLTVYLKKRAFNSLKDEHNSNFMDPGEKLYMRATKILFEKKCLQIAAYESLTKASRLLSEDADLDAQHIDAVFDLLRGYADDEASIRQDKLARAREEGNTILEDILVQQESQSDNVKKSLIELVNLRRRAHKLNQSTTTSWIIDPDQKDIHGVGRGAGVIELTLVNSIRTSLGIDNSSSFNFSMQDPYNLMKITTDDVEIALSAAYTEIQRGGTTTQSVQNSASLFLEQARAKENELRIIRSNKVADSFGLPRSAIGTSARAAEIVFQIDPASSTSYPVSASISSMPGVSFDSDSFRAALISLPVEQQLGITEDRLVGQIFELLGKYIAAIRNINEGMIARNSDEKTIYARRILRQHYLGKSIVQPMDSINVFIRGKTTKDGEVVGPLSSVLNNSSFVQSFKRDRDVSDAVLAEEMKQLGVKNIPVNLYKAVRTGSFMRNAGMHVFAGLVKSVNNTYDAGSGTYVLNISGESNARWLDLSRVNTKPSAEQPSGILEDPLTPFKFVTDPGTGLIAEKPELLSANQELMNNRRLYDNSGLRCGEPINKSTHEQDKIPINGSLQGIWNHAPGMVYTWKPGVMVASVDVNLKTSLTGSDDDLDTLRRYAGLNIVTSPFKGLDSADIISLLVTGYPHSAERFYENSKNIGTFTIPGANASPDYFHSFFDITRSTNKALGNFRPLRSLKSDVHKLTQKLELYDSFTKHKKRLEGLRSVIAEAEDKKILLHRSTTKGDIQSSDSREIDGLMQRLNQTIQDTRNLIQEEQANIKEKAEEAKKQNFIKNTSDIIFKLDDLSSGIETDSNDEARTAASIRNRNVKLRTQYDCKFNSDENYLVIADEYDNDIDIQAFIIDAIGKEQDLFFSDYQFPRHICREVADTIDFEFFNDTQGHMVFRPPQYNRVPLSLILKMFALNANNKIRLYPEFLSAMFETREEAIKTELRIINLQIIEKSLLLGNVDDADALTTMVISGAQGDEIVTAQFIGVENAAVGLTADDINDSVAQNLIRTRYKIRGETDYLVKIGDLDEAKKEIQKYNDPNNPQVNSLRLQLSNKLIQLVSRKQKLLPVLDKIQKQGEAFGKNLKGSDTITIDTSKVKKFLAPYQNLIEDDFNDFLGPGSSQRFIIHDDQIINYDLKESDENALCRVDVNGQIDFLGEGPSNLGGVPMLWAGATDFDMWRQYGYKPATFDKPYFKDAATQSAPYALFMLARARRDIISGSITVYGNEYYQLGDVVYINSREMLYYVSDVSHNFSYGDKFTTTLTLRYGHPLGDYIPTPLDIVGKALIRNQTDFNRTLITRKTTNPNKGLHLGVIRFGTREADDEFQNMLSDPLGAINLTELKKSLLLAKQNVGVFGSISKKVEVRGWIEKEDDKEKVKNRIEAVIQWLVDAKSGRWVPSENDYVDLEDSISANKLEPGDIWKFDSTEPTLLDGSKQDCASIRVPNQEVYNVRNSDIYNSIEIVLLTVSSILEV